MFSSCPEIRAKKTEKRFILESGKSRKFKKDLQRYTTTQGKLIFLPFSLPSGVINMGITSKKMACKESLATLSSLVLWFYNSMKQNGNTVIGERLLNRDAGEK